MANVLVLANALVLGPASGIDLLSSRSSPSLFMIFDLRERWALQLGVALPVCGLIVTEVGLFDRLGILPVGYVASDYHTYSALMAVAMLLFALYQVSHANARAENALRLDIAARERAERALDETRQLSISAAKMAALGEMSANVAHEVNNPLAAILLRAERLEQLGRQGRLDAPAALKNGARDSGDRRAHPPHRRRAAIVRPAGGGRSAPARARALDRQGHGRAVRAALSDERDRAAGRPDLQPDLRVDCRTAEITQILVNLLATPTMPSSARQPLGPHRRRGTGRGAGRRRAHRRHRQRARDPHRRSPGASWSRSSRPRRLVVAPGSGSRSRGGSRRPTAAGSSSTPGRPGPASC